jgi:hypothetical protein
MFELFKKKLEKHRQKQELTEYQQGRIVQEYNSLLLREEKHTRKMNDQAWSLEKKRRGAKDYVV